MTTLKARLLSVLNLMQTFKEERLRWQTEHHDQQMQLKQARILSERALSDELKKKSLQLEHELALVKTKNQAELAMLKTKCQQDVKDYQQYLAALDKLKASIQNSYAHLPEAVAFTIHHHAKHLLDTMWEAKDFEEKMRCEMGLIAFMTAVHEDAHAYLLDGENQKLPEKTLSLLQPPKPIGS